MAEPENTKTPNPINSRVIIVDRFLDGEEADYIQFVLDEGLRERALNELNIVENRTSGSVLLLRDNANFLTVEVPDTDVTGSAREDTLNAIVRHWSTTPGINYKLSRKLTESVIDKEITELL